MSDTVTVRPFEDHDLGETLDTLRLALGETPLLRRTPEWFRWKHFDNPFGRSLLVVAEAGGRIVGLRAFMRWELRTPAGETIRCVRAVDTATHPGHLRRGVFRMLTREALELARADGVDLVFNTPNAKSGAGYLKMGWMEVGSIGVLIRPTRHLFQRRPEEAPQLEEPAFVTTDGQGTSLQARDRRARGLRTPRSPEYLAWRFAGHPTARYERVAVNESIAVVRPNVRNGRSELVVSDVFGPSPARAIAEACRRYRASYSVASFSPESPERRATLRAGMIPLPGVTGFNLVAKPLTEISVDVTHLGNWDFAISDFELL